MPLKPSGKHVNALGGDGRGGLPVGWKQVLTTTVLAAFPGGCEDPCSRMCSNSNRPPPHSPCQYGAQSYLEVLRSILRTDQVPSADRCDLRSEPFPRKWEYRSHWCRVNDFYCLELISRACQRRPWCRVEGGTLILLQAWGSCAVAIYFYSTSLW